MSEDSNKPPSINLEELERQLREALALLEHEQLIAPKGRDLFVKQISRDEFI